MRQNDAGNGAADEQAQMQEVFFLAEREVSDGKVEEEETQHAADEPAEEGHSLPLPNAARNIVIDALKERRRKEPQNNGSRNYDEKEVKHRGGRLLDVAKDACRKDSEKYHDGVKIHP